MEEKLTKTKLLICDVISDLSSRLEATKAEPNDEICNAAEQEYWNKNKQQQIVCVKGRHWSGSYGVYEGQLLFQRKL